jgi:hypothetical protein
LKSVEYYGEVEIGDFTCLCLEIRQAFSQRRISPTATPTQMLRSKDRRSKIKNDSVKVRIIPAMKANGLSFFNLAQ